MDFTVKDGGFQGGEEGQAKRISLDPKESWSEIEAEGRVK